MVEFDGDPKAWLGFWSQFKEIHSDKSLSNEVKFQYLIQATAINSDARNVVSNFPPTGANYQKAIDHLTSRFGKENILIEVYVRAFLELVLSNSDGKQILPLTELYDGLATQLQALDTLGVESALPEDVSYEPENELEIS